MRPLQYCAIAATLLLTAAAPAPALPGMGTAHRSSVDHTALPWSALARVQIPGGPRCTGVFLDATTVLTAAHCVFLPRTRKFAPPGSVHVLAGYKSGDYSFHTTLTALRPHPNWDGVGSQHLGNGLEYG